MRVARDLLVLDLVAQCFRTDSGRGTKGRFSFPIFLDGLHRAESNRPLSESLTVESPHRIVRFRSPPRARSPRCVTFRPSSREIAIGRCRRISKRERSQKGGSRVQNFGRIEPRNHADRRYSGCSAWIFVSCQEGIGHFDVDGQSLFPPDSPLLWRSRTRCLTRNQV